MRVLLQRVSDAWIGFGGEETPHAGPGLLGLVGFHETDSGALLDPMAQKLVHLRIFDDQAGKMNLSLLDAGGALVMVSQFTLYADCRKGRRPSYVRAMQPAAAEGLYDRFIAACEAYVAPVISGRFGAEMAVHLVNDGPVTIMLDSADWALRGRPPAS